MDEDVGRHRRPFLRNAMRQVEGSHGMKDTE